MPFTFDTLANRAVTSLRYPHTAGDGRLRVWNATPFPSPTRVVVFSGSTPYTERIYGIYRVTAVDAAAQVLTIAEALEGTSDVDIPAQAHVELRATAGQYADLATAIRTLAAGDPVETTLSTFVYNQETPSAEWTIAHLMNRFPSVTVVDSAGTVVVGEVKYDSANQVTVKFSAGFSGSAYLN